MLDREVVRLACSDAALDATRVDAAFVTVMAWGYGGVGYGPYRTRTMLAGTPRAGERLTRVARTLHGVGALAAYGALARLDECGLAGLGPAFGTKYLYFCQPLPAATTALILDSLVAAWLRRETELRVKPLGWSVTTYRRYIEHMHDWAASLGVRPMSWSPAHSRRWRLEGHPLGRVAVTVVTEPARLRPGAIP